MQMKIAVTWPNEPRISLGDISLKYMGRALKEMPTKEEQNPYIKSIHLFIMPGMQQISVWNRNLSSNLLTRVAKNRIISIQR